MANKDNIKIRVKTPTVLQMEAVECGAASLAMILGFYGKNIPLEEVRAACGVSRDGIKASNIVRAAEGYGLSAEGFRVEPYELKSLELPVIIHWNFNHFLVLEGFSKDKVYLNDPAFGRRVIGVDEFDQSFTGIALTFKPEKEFKADSKKKNLFALLRERSRGSEWAITYIIIAGILMVVPGILIPTFSRIFIDNIMLKGMTDWLKPLVIGMILTALFRGLITWLQQHYILRLETKLAISESSKFTWHILLLPIEFFGQRFAGEIANRIQMNDRLAKLLASQVANIFLNAVIALFYLIIMFQYNIVLTLLTLLIAIANMVFLKIIGEKRLDLNQRLMQEKGKLQGISTSGLQILETLKARGAESDFFAQWAGYQAKLVNSEQKMEYTGQMLAAVPIFLHSLNTAVIICAGGYFVMNGEMSIGMLVAFQSLMESFIGPIGTLVSNGGKLQEAKGFMERLDDAMKYHRDSEANRIMDDLKIGKNVKLEGYLEINEASFGYSSLEPPLIKEFSLKLKPGYRVAVVGSSGSGKSTVSKLIAGLYKPWDGNIYFDGRMREEIPKAVISNSVSMVDQDIVLFEGTIRDNITLWDSSITEDDVVKAARDAMIHDDIMSMANGYESRVSEDGKNMSGGQKQRIEIARALVNNPSIIILDEATSALDPITEKQIDDNIRKRGCACIIVAHRLSTIRDCDEIIVLKNGVTVERGNHDELIEVQGIYNELIKDY